MPIQYTNENELKQDLQKIKANLASPINAYLNECLNKFISGEKVFPLTDNYQLINLASIVFWRIADGLEAKDPWSNSVDPLTFILGAAYTEAESLGHYSKAEEQRQKEKSIGGHFGYFSQGLIRLAFKDDRPLSELFENSGTRFDVESGDKTIAIEVKSKWNTTKGDSRAAKYQGMWEMKNNFSELYFAEILAKPGQNFNPEHSLLDAEKWPNFWICNGEFIYQKASRLQGITLTGSILKNLYFNFAGILWVYFLLYEFKQGSNEVSQEIQKFSNWAENKLRENQFKTDRHRIMMRIFSNLSTENGMGELFTNNSRLYPVERKQAKDLVILQTKFKNLNSFSASVKSSIEKFTNNFEDLSFLNDQLIGHL